MEDGSTATDFFRRKFGHYNFIWEIENFRIASCEENWQLESPVLEVINGHQVTKWVMALRPKMKNGENYAVLSLKRLKTTDNGPHVVWVQWRSWIKLIESNNEEKERNLNEYEHEFKEGEIFESDHLLLKNLYFYSKPFIHDVFKIKCLFVLQLEYKDVPVTNVSVGINALSEALSKLIDFGLHYDVKLDTNIANIRAHKAILHYRNRTFAEKIEKYCKNDTIDLSQKEHCALNNIIYYLYTGNLEFILQRPTIAIEELALDFQIDEIKNCYILNTLFLESTYGIEQHYFTWDIPEYGTGNQRFRVSPTVDDILNFSWKLYFYLNTSERTEYVSICLSLFGGPKPGGLCIELAVLDDRGRCIHSKRKCKKLHYVIGFQNFMKKDDVRAALINDTLKIRLRIIVSPIHNWSSSGWRNNDLLPVAKLDPYAQLSSDMARMFTEGKFSDITIQAEGRSYKAHLCILAVRSSVLTDMLRDYNVTLPDMESRILQILLYYMYTGVLKDYKFKDIYKIYDYAVSYDISTLPGECSSILRDNMKVESVVDILVFSTERNDRLLKQSAMDFVSQNRNQVFGDDSWKELVKVKRFLCHEVRKYLKDKNKKYLILRKKFISSFRRK